MATNNQTGKLSAKTIFGYGAAGYGAAMFYNNFCFYALYFFTDYVGMAPFIASLVISLGAIWDAITDPVTGHWSDHRDPKKGRRRPFLLYAALPLAIFNWLAFTDPGLRGGKMILFYVIVIFGAYLCQTMVDIPYTALGTEITEDYDERSKLSSARNIFWLISILISSYFLAIVDVFGGGTGGYSKASLLCSIPIVITIWIAYAATKGLELQEVKHNDEEKFSFRRSYIEPFKNKPFRFVTALFALSIVAQAVNNSVSIYFYTHVMELSETATANFLVYAALCGFLGIWLANKVCLKVDKKWAWAIFMGCWAISMGGIGLFVLNPTSSLFIIAIFGLLYGMGLNVQYQLVWAMIPDCVEVDEWQTGERREGLFYGITNLIQKLGAALIIALSGVALTAIGYDGNAAVQPEGIVMSLRLLLTLGTSIPLILSIVCGFMNPMTRERHAALVDALEKRKNGEPYDTSGFDAVL